MLDKETLHILENALGKLNLAFSDLPPLRPNFQNNEEMARDILEVAERLQDNYPYFHPLYAGQMLKPPHPVARLAYMLSMWINPNNHALDGGRASSQMEKEAISNIAQMIGSETHLGHIYSGGTIANLEALWIAGKLNPNKKIVASQQAHYTHSRISGVLGLQFEPIPCDSKGRIDINQLQRCLDNGNVGTVVATIGTTAIGSVSFTGFARDAAGNFYLSALGAGGNAPVFGNTAILKIDAQGVESVYAGHKGLEGEGDGIGSAAQFSDPRSPSIDGNGNLVVLDRFVNPNSHLSGHIDDSYSLRRISPEGGTTSIVRMEY